MLGLLVIGLLAIAFLGACVWARHLQHSRELLRLALVEQTAAMNGHVEQIKEIMLDNIELEINAGSQEAIIWELRRQQQLNHQASMN